MVYCEKLVSNAYFINYEGGDESTLAIKEAERVVIGKRYPFNSKPTITWQRNLMGNQPSHGWPHTPTDCSSQGKIRCSGISL